MLIVTYNEMKHTAPNADRAHDDGCGSGKASLSGNNSSSNSCTSRSGSTGGDDSSFGFQRQAFEWRLRGTRGYGGSGCVFVSSTWYTEAKAEEAAAFHVLAVEDRS